MRKNTVVKSTFSADLMVVDGVSEPDSWLSIEEIRFDPVTYSSQGELRSVDYPECQSGSALPFRVVWFLRIGVSQQSK